MRWRICAFSRELSPVMMFGENSYRVKDYLRAAAVYYPHWDKAYAEQLVARFGLDRKKKISKLSKGMMSMVTIVLALASRAPITILDEPVAGLDVVAREDFLPPAAGRLHRDRPHVHRVHAYH